MWGGGSHPMASGTPPRASSSRFSWTQPKRFCSRFHWGAGPGRGAQGAALTRARAKSQFDSRGSSPCQRFIPCHAPTLGCHGPLGAGSRHQPQPSRDRLNTRGSPGRLSLTLQALMAAPFPTGRKSTAKASKLCRETSAVPGRAAGCERSPGLSRQERPIHSSSLTAEARREPAWHRGRR